MIIQTSMYKVHKQQGYTVEHRKSSIYPLCCKMQYNPLMANNYTSIMEYNLQRRKEYTMEKRQSIQQVILEIVDSFMKKNQTRILFHIIYKTKFKMNLRFK